MMKNSLSLYFVDYLWKYFPKLMYNREWKSKGKYFDWNNPKDINEKIIWLNVNTDTSEWSRLADKYLVREYVKSKGLDELLISLYGKWDKVSDINYDSLPSKFVLKCNHDSGSYQIIDKEKGFDKERINIELDKCLHKKFGYHNGELYYTRIKRRIIAEEYLESNNTIFSTSLVDYKVWCFNGKPYCIFTVYNRTKDFLFTNVYDLNWQVHPEWSVFTDHFRDGEGKIPRPASLDKMLEAASILSDGFPEVRVDFYDVDGKLYFGEMTFTSASGRMNYFTDDFLKEMGDQCIIPQLMK